MSWTNWAGNQSCSPARVVAPASEDEVVQEVRRALADGSGLRPAGAGHSFTPVIDTSGTVLELTALRGVTGIDAPRRLVTALPGTTVGEFGDPLWAAGLALANQGDIDTQAIAGAVATGTHGSGNALPSFSATLRACRLVDGRGEVVEIDESRPELLRAAQVAVGMLGVMTSLTIEAVPAYRLNERIEHRPLEDVLSGWDDLFAGHRHFSFFWLPSEHSAELYGLPTPPGRRMTDTCYVKTYDEAGDEMPDDATPGNRVGRSHRIYPMEEFEPNFHELEYFVPLERGREAVEAMRELMLASRPDAVFPMEVRTTAADEAYLSSNHRRATTVISVSGVPGTDYWPYLRAVDRLLGEFEARVHWGKLHFLTPEQLARRYPESARFIALRREFDPDGVFLNDHLRPLFA
ncbi:MAG TPA: D-arabinono-1,4-lactone oxidase [Gaiellales bacterium]|jgi:FAD/FMN-containing dehydrogenase|nr:D-arabinono-1,4-lactone oxidase [Gaiellales bacterium]